MTCLRCEGLMIQDEFFDLHESERRLAVWRCVLCGAMVDPVIAANRRLTLSRVESLAHAGGYRIPRPSLAKVA